MTIKRFLIQQAIAGGVINAVLNGPPVLLLLSEGVTWPLWKGLPSIALDTCAMSFGVAGGTGWLLTGALRKQVAQGKVTLPRGLPERVKVDFGKWPASALHRGLNLGGLALLVCALPTIGVLYVLGVEAWGPTAIVTYKTVYGLLMGAAFTPMTAVGVMVEHEPSAAALSPAIADPER